MRPKLTLLGAGPGDPELLTIKGMKVLSEADVVLYDALVNEELLQYANQAKVIKFVGKRSGRHSLKQEKINQLIVEMAYLYGHVIRLKGGDPLVFARGFEELEYANANGLDCQVIPGVSSALSLNSAYQIPLTHRKLSRSIHIYTATDLNGELSDDLINSVNTNGIKVILMGFSKLDKIVKLYRENGLYDLPVMIVQNGTLPDERSVSGTIDTILEKVMASGISTPACIYIGETIGLIKNGIYAKQELSISDFS